MPGAPPRGARTPLPARAVRLVHLSDLHLGYRQYQRLTPTGINQREADVATSFRRVVDKVIELHPELVVIGGDVFHTVRPSNPAILHAFQQFARLRAALPDTLVVMIAGNHDTPRSTETGCILQLFASLGMDVVTDAPQRLEFPDRDLSILCVPDVFGSRPKLVPEGSARHQVLLLHGEVEGMLDAGVVPADRAALEISKEELGASRWSYVALGHYHVYREIAPNAFYAGSIDYTSANAWGEIREQRAAGIPGKGIIERDLDTGRQWFHPIAPSRELVDLPPIVARDMTAAEVDAAIRAAVEGCPGGIADKVVRLVVRQIPRHITRELDHKAIRDFKRRALHFLLDTHRPDPVRAGSTGSGAPGRRPSLADVVREKLQTRAVDPQVDRAALVSLGLHYLALAESEHAGTGVVAGAAAPDPGGAGEGDAEGGAA